MAAGAQTEGQSAQRGSIAHARESATGALARKGRRRLWPLYLLLAAGAALRLSTLGLQSLWYDEAFTAVHVFNGSFGHMLAQLPHTENTPPLWYVLEWAIIQVLGHGAVALRLLSALAGVALIGVMWAIGQELYGRRVAIIAAALAAASPLFVWYSQEARAYSLYTLMAALAFLAFLRAERRPSAGRVGAFALASVLALLTHYFAVFLVVPMALYLVRSRARLATRAPWALVAIGLCGAALMPLALAQGGRGAEWIAQTSLLARVEAVPQYYLTGYSGAPLGHAVELLVALPLIGACVLGLWRVLDPLSGDARAARGSALCFGVGACGTLLPLALIAFGQDFFDPRNVIGAMVMVSAGIALLAGARVSGRAGALLAAIGVLALLAVSIDVNFNPRLQRGDWHGVAKVLSSKARALGIARGEMLLATVHLGSAPLEYYLPALRPAGTRALALRAIAQVGYAPLAPNAAQPPVPGFQLAARSVVNGLDIFIFTAPKSRRVAPERLLEHPLTPSAGRQALLAFAGGQ
jgi:mannosyltransferase